MAHTLAVVGVHLNVAADALDTAPDEARAALRLAQDVRRKAMGDLSSLVGVLRDDRRPTAEPLDLETLVAQVRAAGLDAHLHVDGAGAALPVRTGGRPRRPGGAHQHRAARRGADASPSPSTTDRRPRSRSPTTARGSGAPFGHGLTGMRERVEALGGSLTTDGAGGFAVHATIPS